MTESGHATHSLDERILIDFDWNSWFSPQTLDEPEEYDFDYEITGVRSETSKNYKPSKLVLKMLYGMIEDSDSIESIQDR